MPTWYGVSLEADDRRFRESACGEGFYGWYLEYVVGTVESAYERSPHRECAHPLLPGLEMECYYGIQ